MEPRLDDEDLRRKESLLNVLFLFTNAILFVFFFLTAWEQLVSDEPYRGMSTWIFCFISLSGAALWFLAKKGHLDTASYGLISVYYAGATYGAVRWGVDMQMVMLAYVMIILVGYILTSPTKGNMITAILCLNFVLLWQLQIRGIITVETDWRDRLNPGDAYEFILVYVAIASVAWLGLKQIFRSLERARASEKKLREERNLLEVRVEERTQKIKEVQSEKVSQLYRFAEFGRISAGMFHDLNSPLAALALSVEKIKNCPQFSGTTIASDVERIVRMSDRLGDFMASIQKSVKTQDTASLFCLNDEIKDALDVLSYKIRMLGTKMDLCLRHRIYHHGNPLRFHQAVLNIISNALDAQESMRGEKKISIRLVKKGKSICLSVVDNGCGIPAHILPRICDPFFTTKSVHRGTGIGLSQTKSIVEQDMKGTLSIESVEGTGTTVHISFTQNK